MKKVILNLLMLLPVSMFAKSNVEISGRVLDIHTGSPLFECHVYLTENYGVLTNEKGVFTLEVPEGYENELLHISYVGYETFTKPLNEINEEFISVNLIEDIPMLDEVVVVADPWKEFKDIVVDLSLNYESEDEFYTDLLEELKRIELDFEMENNKKAGVGSGSWPVFVFMSLIILTGAFIARPLIARFNNPK